MRIIDVVPEVVNNQLGYFLVLSWQDDTGYFGEVEICFNGDLAPRIKAETMSKEFVKRVLNKMIDESELIS